MDLKNIVTFIRVVELNSFTKAALELNYAQSTVTAQIQQLEIELGYPLFDRIGKSVSLTIPGSDFLKYAYKISEEMNKAYLLSKDIKKLSGTLRIGVIESLLYETTSDLLPALKNDFVNLNIKIKTGQTTELIEMLKKNKLDLIYISADQNTDSDLHCSFMKEEKLVFLSSPEHILSCEKSISVTELFNYNFVVTEHTGVCYSRLKQLAAKNDSILHETVEVDSTLVVSDMIKKNLGIGFLPEYSVKNKLDNSELIKLDVNIPHQIYYKQILSHKSRWHSPFMEKFVDTIKTHNLK